jgi:hypothetical protein
MTIGRLRWLGHIFGLKRLDLYIQLTSIVSALQPWEGLGLLNNQSPVLPYIQLTLLKPDSSGPVGKPKLRWLGSVGEDLKKTDVRNWRRM